MRHQVVDTGLDETSCFFIDDDGEELPHGYYYERFGFVLSSSSSASQPPAYSPLSETPPPRRVTFLDKFPTYLERNYFQRGPPIPLVDAIPDYL